MAHAVAQRVQRLNALEINLRHHDRYRRQRVLFQHIQRAAKARPVAEFAKGFITRQIVDLLDALLRLQLADYPRRGIVIQRFLQIDGDLRRRVILRRRGADVFVNHVAYARQGQRNGDHHHRQERRQRRTFQILYRAVPGVAHLLIEYVALAGSRIRRRFWPFRRIASAATARPARIAETVESIAESANVVHCLALIHRYGLHAYAPR